MVPIWVEGRTLILRKSIRTEVNWCLAAGSQEQYRQGQETVQQRWRNNGSVFGHLNGRDRVATVYDGADWQRWARRRVWLPGA